MEEERMENGEPNAPEETPVRVEQGTLTVDKEQVIEPENALPEVTLEGLPEPLRAAC